MEDSFKSDVFGVEKENGKVEGILAAVYQSMFGGDVYPSLEEKAANYGVYTGFPKKKFSHVIDDSIDNYRIIYYNSYKGSGSKIFTIVTNPNTGRIIIYAGGNN